MRNKFLYMVLVLTMLVLAACGGTATPSATTGPTAGQNPTTPPAVATNTTGPVEPSATTPPAVTPTAEVKGTLQVAVVDFVKDKTDTWLMNEVVPAFQKENPGWNVEFIWLSWGTYDEALQGYFAAGAGPDIINFGSEYIASYGDKLVPLNSQLQGWPDIQQYVPALVDAVTWDGEVRGLPWLVAPRAEFCRTDLLSGGKVPTTFEEAVTQAAADTKVEDNKLVQAGYWEGSDWMDWQHYLSYIWSLGGEIYDEKGMPLFESEQAKAALKFQHDRRKAVRADENVAPLGEATGSRLAANDTVCTWGNLWGAPATTDPLWEKIEIYPGVTDPKFNSKPAVQIFTDWLGIPQYSKNQEAAIAFLKFLGTAENANKYNEAFGSFPGRVDAMTGFVENAPMQTMAKLMTENGKAFADVRESAQLRDILQQELARYATDTQDLDTTAKNIQTRYTEVLQEAGRISQ